MCDLHKRFFVEGIPQKIFLWDTFSTQDLLWKVSHKRCCCGIPSPHKIFCGRCHIYRKRDVEAYLPQKIFCGEGIPQKDLLRDTFHKRSFVEILHSTTDLLWSSFVEGVPQKIFLWDTFSTKIFCGMYASTSLFLYIWYLPQKILCGEGIPQQDVLWDTFHKRSFVEGVPLHLSFYIYIYIWPYILHKRNNTSRHFAKYMAPNA